MGRTGRRVGGPEGLEARLGGTAMLLPTQGWPRRRGSGGVQVTVQEPCLCRARWHPPDVRTPEIPKHIFDYGRMKF